MKLENREEVTISDPMQLLFTDGLGVPAPAPAIVIAQIERIRSSFDYDPITGILTRKSTSRAAGYKRYKNGNPDCISVKFEGKERKCHHLAWAIMKGGLPEQLDHRDGDPFNNKWSNLREADRFENMKNRRTRNKFGLRGVYKYKKGWFAEIKSDGKRIYLGSFPTKGLAAVARAKAALRYHGQFARI